MKIPRLAAVDARDNVERMAFDGTDFVDTDYSQPRSAGSTGRAPTREELDAQLTGTQQQLAKLREAQEQLERARAAVEEMRRQRAEFAAGRTEMLQGLTRSITILQKAELEARRDAEQMNKSLSGLQSALAEVERFNEQAWSADDWQQELNRAMAGIENARMEYNTARLKWPILEGNPPGATATPTPAPDVSLANLPLGRLCKVGLALNWPVALVFLLGVVAFLFVVLKR